MPGQATTNPDTRADHGLAVQKDVVGADAVEAQTDLAASTDFPTEN